MSQIRPGEYMSVPFIKKQANGQRGMTRFEMLRQRYYTNNATAIAIINAIEKETGGKWEKIIEKGRSRPHVELRQLFCMIIKQIRGNGITLQDIQKQIGARTHATVIYGIKNISGLVETDRSVRDMYNAIIKQL